MVSVPSLWAIRETWPNAQITLLSDKTSNQNYVLAKGVLGGSSLIDDFLEYKVDARDRFGPLRQIWPHLRSRRFDAVVYLAPSTRRKVDVLRDFLYFKSLGARKIYGATPRLIKKIDPSVREFEILLNYFWADNPTEAATAVFRYDIDIGDAEENQFRQWRDGCGLNHDFKLIGVGPGSKMPAKRWPLDRYSSVVSRLIEEKDVVPIIFGGLEDKQDAETVIARWGRGHVAAGVLNVRTAARALKECAFYLGNDTGTMHLAASVGTPCIAVFSARDLENRWHPVGEHHTVIRFNTPCAGCMLTNCVELQNVCLTQITAERVYAACIDEMARQEKSATERTAPFDLGFR